MRGEYSSGGEAVRLGRYTLLRFLGEGAMGRVYEALDDARNLRVALKVMRDNGAATAHLLKREFRALADLSHTNLVTFHEACVEHDVCYFTMELIHGGDFLSYVWRHAGGFATGADVPRPDFARLRSALRQLASALSALHAAGMVHRDLKPSNVLVTDSGRVVVLDFGLIRCDEAGAQHSTFAGRAVGTPAYMAPEQLNLQPVTPASDCYAIGGMLFHALVGDVPFQGVETERIARVKATSEPPVPSQFVSDVPSDLDELCRDLLSPNPGARPTCREILERLGATAEPPARAPLSSEPEEDAPFVGRESELNALRAALRARASHCVVAAVGGPAGVGKTTLVRRFLAELDRARHVVLTAKCYERESLPYKTLDGLIDALIQFLRPLMSLEIARLMPRHLPELLAMFPALGRVEALAGTPQPSRIADEHEHKQRALAALRELLARISDRGALVLWIDDLQWGDRDSMVFIRQMLSSPDAPLCLCIGSIRAENVQLDELASAFFGQDGNPASNLDLRTIRVGGLSAAEAQELASKLLGDGDAVAAERVARESAGSPFLVSQLVDFARGKNYGDRKPERTTLAQMVAARVAQLSPAAAEVLQLVALARSPIEQRVVASAARLTSPGAFHELRTARLVRTQGTRERSRVEIYHGRLAPPVIGLLDAQSVRDLHGRLAAALIERGTRDHERVAYHLRKAGKDEEALAQLLAGADRAMSVLAHERAARLYSLALKVGLAGEQVARVKIALAEALRLAGHSYASAQAYVDAARTVGNAWQSFELRRKAAQEFLLNGHLDEGRALLIELLPRVQLSLPSGRANAVFGLLARRALLRLRGIRFRRRAEPEVASAELARVDTCWLLGQGLVMVDPLLGNNLQSRHVLLALRSGEPSRVARALALDAVCASYPGPSARRRVDHLLATASELSMQVEGPLTRATTMLWGAATAYFMGDPERALAEAEVAERMLREQCTGTAYELATCHLIALGSYNMLGDWSTFSRRAQQALSEAVQRGNRYQSVGLRSHTHMARLVAGDPQGARAEIEIVRSDWPQDAFHMQHLAIFIGYARVHLYEGDGVAAYLHLAKSWPDAARSMMLRARFLSVEALSWRARAATLAYAQTGEKRYRRAGFRDARALARQPFLGAAGNSMLVRGSLYAIEGRTEQALRWLGRAAAAFESERLPFFAALARYQASAVGDSPVQRTAAESERAIAAADVRDVPKFVQMFTGLPAKR